MTSGPSLGARAWVRLYRLTLRALPRGLRRKHGPAMEALFVRELQRTSRAGRLRGALCGIGASWDVLRRALYERTRLGAGGPGSRRPPGRAARSGSERLLDDLRHGIRSLRRSPAFTGASVAILALGIGASTTVFSAYRALVLEDLPLTDPDRIVLLTLPQASTGTMPLTVEEIEALGRESRTLEQAAGVATFGAVAIPLTEGERSLALSMSKVTADFFHVLGARPALGRLLRPEDGEEGAAPVAVLGYEAWLRDFGGDPAVLGRRLTQTQYDQSYSIVGVAPPGLDHPVGVDYWIPVGPRDGLAAIGRLAAGATAEAARSELLSIVRALDRRRTTPRSPAAATVVPLARAVLGDAKPILTAIAAAVAVLLLITCMNVGNLLLMRVTRRAHEGTVRRALGATSGAVTRLFLTEAVLLGTGGGVLGLALAAGLLEALPPVLPVAFPRAEMIGLVGLPVGLAAGVTAAAVLLFGVAPAVTAARGDLGSALRIDGGSTTGTSGRRRARRTLVAAQVALAVVLLFGAGLLARSLQHLTRLELGYDAEHVGIVEMGFSRDVRGGPAEAFALLDGIRERLLGVPGVTAASPIMSRPFLGGTGIFTGRPILEGQSASEAASNPRFPLEVGGRDLFRTLGIPVVRGRGLLESDREGAERVAVVSEAVAERLWPGEDPVGRRFRMVTSAEHSWTVVGVAGETRFRAHREPTPTIYVHVRQLQILPAVWTWAVRTDGDLASAVPDIRRVVGDVDPRIHVWRARSLERHLAEGPLAQPRTSALLLSSFGLAALSLAAVGLYAVMALSVRERTRELGVRMALGASARRLRLAVLRDTLVVTLGGTIAGAGGALLISRPLSGLLFEVGPADPVTLAGVCGALLTIALIAAYLPARRATRTDPVRALGSG